MERLSTEQIISSWNGQLSAELSTAGDYPQHILHAYQALKADILASLGQATNEAAKEREFIFNCLERGLMELMTLLLDQTGRKESQLKEDYRALLEGAKDHAIIRTDLNGVILEWNKGAENILQHGRDEAIGKNIKMIFTAEDLAKDADRFEREQAKNQGKAEDKRWHVRKDGSQFFANGSLNPIHDEQDRTIGFVKVMRDETQQLASEEALEEIQERFRAATLATGIGIWDLDLTDDTSWRSESHDRLWGFNQPVQDWGIERALQHVHPEDRELFKNSASEAIARKGMWKVEFRNIWPDQSLHWMRATGQVMLDDEGRPVKIIGTNFDITEQKNMLRNLENETNIREKIISTLSHDLRTPLTAVKMSAQLISRRSEDEKIRNLSLRIDENIERADRMIQDLLDASKIKAGQLIMLKMQDIDVVEVLQHTLDNLTSIHGDRFKLFAPSKLPAYLCPGSVTRIIENLCTNAIKYGQVNEPIDVQVEHESEHDHLLLTVKNTVDPSIQLEPDILFKLYGQGSTAELSGQKGWGIGLTIVKGLTESHGGKVAVDSCSTSTIFKVQLPRDARSFT
jgi:PAS domain S-box-containing protein